MMGDLSSARSGSPATSASASRASSSRRSDVTSGSSPHPGMRPLSKMSSSSSLRCGVPDVAFVNPPDPAHMCPVCDRAMRYPVKLGDCGHRCCSGCLVELVRSVAAVPRSRHKLTYFCLLTCRACSQLTRLCSIKLSQSYPECLTIIFTGK